jgi:hypothetical protein
LKKSLSDRSVVQNKAKTHENPAKHYKTGALGS